MHTRTTAIVAIPQACAVIFTVLKQVYVAVHTAKAPDHESEAFFDTPTGCECSHIPLSPDRALSTPFSSLRMHSAQDARTQQQYGSTAS